MSVLVIEQNIGVATAISKNVAIMVNGRINRIIDSARLAADRELQQRLLGVGRPRRAGADIEAADAERRREARPAAPRAASGADPDLHLQSRRCRRAGRSRRRSRASRPPRARSRRGVTPARRRPRGSKRRAGAAQSASGPPVVLVAGTLDTKGEELRFIRDMIAGQRLADAAGRRLHQRQALHLRRLRPGNRAEPRPRRLEPCSAPTAAPR